jgi:glycosyltransferase involved in cell wall biosynthesis
MSHAAPSTRPDVWITYHPYYKAPDLLGPALAAAWDIPLVAIEASHAMKRADGPHARWHAHATAGLRASDLLLAMTERDRAGLERLPPGRHRIGLLPPFLADPGPAPAPRSARAPVRLITVAMMRPGVKAQSYRWLAHALARLESRDWHLTLVGDGPARAEVEAAFAGLPADRVRFAGLADAASVRAAFDAADIHVWPGHREAYGMVFLEAAARGLPSVAMASGGVSSVVLDGETGLLAADGDVAGLAAALDRLIGDPVLRARLGAAGRALVTGPRGLDAAAAALDRHLQAALAGRRPVAQPS